MHIEPLAWIVTAPLIGFLFWARRLPAEHVIKQLHQRLCDHDATTMSAVGLDPTALRRFDRVAFAVLVIALVVATTLSFSTWLGVIG